MSVMDHSRHQETFKESLNELRSNALLCDVMFVFPEEKRNISAHRAIMASSSGYFRGLFTSQFSDPTSVIELPRINADTMEELISYIYTQNPQITIENVQDIMTASDRFHIFGLQKLCSEFLMKHVSVENCLGIYEFSDYHNFQALAEETLLFVLYNILDVANVSFEFLRLDKHRMIEILRHDQLNVDKEDQCLQIIHKWMEFSPDTRWPMLTDLLKSVRLFFVTEGHLKTSFSALCDKERVLPEFINNIENHRNELMCFPSVENYYLRPRIPCDLLFVLGGWSMDGVNNVVETFDLRVSRWYSKQVRLPGNRAYHGVASLNGEVYIIGGYDGKKYHNSVHCFDPAEQLWREVAPMHSQRCYVAVTTYKGGIYVCGGYDGNPGKMRHRTSEVYTPTNNQWELITPMIKQRSDAGAANLNDRIYVVGGFDGHHCLRCAEMYDPETKQWTLIESMNFRRSGVGLVSYDEELYAIGGYDGSERLSCVERYCPTLRAWVEGEDLNHGRSNFAVALVGSRIMIMGGYDGSTTTNRVEYFEKGGRRWTVDTDMIIGRSAVSACTITGLGNTADFTFHGNQNQVDSKL